MKSRPVLIIDGNMLVHRTYEAMDDLCSSDGTPTGMEYGFLRVVERLQKEFSSCDIFIAWDCKTAKSKRQEIAPEYKAQRTPNTERNKLYARVEVLRSDVLRARFYEISKLGLEADDLLYSYAEFARECDYIIPHVFLYTNDEDLLQAVTERCTVLKSFRSKIFTWDSDKVFEKFKVRPGILPLYRAVVGDKSDNLPGCISLGKAWIAMHCRTIYRENVTRRGLVQVKRLVKMANKQRKRFTIKAWDKWAAFIQSGQLVRNYKCMCLMPKDYDLFPPTGDNYLAAEALAKWEIFSLCMSAELLGDRDVDEDEF